MKRHLLVCIATGASLVGCATRDVVRAPGSSATAAVPSEGPEAYNATSGQLDIHTDGTAALSLPAWCFSGCSSLKPPSTPTSALRAHSRHTTKDHDAVRSRVSERVKCGSSRLEAGELEAAQQSFEAALVIDPYNRDALRGLRRVHVQRFGTRIAEPAISDFWSVEEMRRWEETTGMPFPHLFLFSQPAHLHENGDLWLYTRCLQFGYVAVHFTTNKTFSGAEYEQF